MGEARAQPVRNPIQFGAHSVQEALLLPRSFPWRDREQCTLLAEQSLDSREGLELLGKRRKILRIALEEVLGSRRPRHEDLISRLRNERTVTGTLTTPGPRGQSGRTWDRTRDLSRVKRALSR
jgi:hypothetical protein